MSNKENNEMNDFIETTKEFLRKNNEVNNFMETTKVLMKKLHENKSIGVNEKIPIIYDIWKKVDDNFEMICSDENHTKFVELKFVLLKKCFEIKKELYNIYFNRNSYYSQQPDVLEKKLYLLLESINIKLKIHFYNNFGIFINNENINEIPIIF